MLPKQGTQTDTTSSNDDHCHLKLHIQQDAIEQENTDR